MIRFFGIVTSFFCSTFILCLFGEKKPVFIGGSPSDVKAFQSKNVFDEASFPTDPMLKETCFDFSVMSRLNVDVAGFKIGEIASPDPGPDDNPALLLRKGLLLSDYLLLKLSVF